MTNPRSLIGATLGGRYQVTEILGQGGMSAVYKAYDPNLQRVVAVKTIHFHLSHDPKFVVRFQEEAASVAKLRHPNIVQVFDFNQDNDLYYMVQEFVPGETLQDRLGRLNREDRRMPLPEAIRYTIQLCNALEYAHSRGLIHRDIKPANIMLDVNGDAILMDFGIVKIVGGQSHTASGAVVGTALYMPPEMIRGEAPGPRSDMYSLGVTLFEMVSGRPPYDAESAMALMMMHVNDPVPNLSNLRPGVPYDLAAVIEQALAKRPEARFGSMADMAAALKTVLNRLQTGVSGSVSLPGAPGPGAFGMPTQRDGPPSGGFSDPNTAAVTLPELGDSHADRWPERAPGGGGTTGWGAGSTPAPGMGMGAGASSDWNSTTPGMGSRAPSESGYSPSSEITRPPNRTPLVLALGAGAVVLLAAIACLAFVALPALRGLGEATAIGAAPSVTSAAGNLNAPPQPTATTAPTSTPAPSATATLAPSDTPLPSDTPTPTLSPTPTIPVGVPYSQIKSIALDEQGQYAVEYETYEFTEALAGLHLVFYFDTQTTDLGYMYGGPRPFAKFSSTQRPKDAAFICIGVSNADHSVREASGNCLPLPDVVVAFANRDLQCLLGPGEEYDPVSAVSAGQGSMVRGMSADEAWWNVVDPKDRSQSCWIAVADTQVAGDIATLPLAEAPLLDPANADALQVEITGITVDTAGRYEVVYSTTGFQEQLPGTHLHFYWNTFTAEQVGIESGGNRLMYGGPSPFSGFTVADKPPQATQICVAIANPDHTILSTGENCFDLPAAHAHTNQSTTPANTQPKDDEGGGGGYDY